LIHPAGLIHVQRHDQTKGRPDNSLKVVASFFCGITQTCSSSSTCYCYCC